MILGQATIKRISVSTSNGDNSDMEKQRKIENLMNFGCEELAENNNYELKSNLFE